MAKYAVPFYTYAYTIVHVEADSPDEAIDLAEDFPTICGQCSGWGSTENNSGIELGGDWELATDDEPWVIEE